MHAAYTIGRLARASGVNVETVRYYQRRGLMAEPERPVGSARRYGEADARRLRFIKAAQGAGFSLAEVSTLIGLEQNRSCRAMRVVVAEKLHAIEARLEQLQALRGELSDWLDQCDANPNDGDCPALSAIDAAAGDATTLGSQRNSAPLEIAIE